MSAESYVRFVDPTPSTSGKTTSWTVLSVKGDTYLGCVEWFGRWRCYAFFPATKSIFEKKCLRDIATFCEEETKNHRRKKS